MFWFMYAIVQLFLWPPDHRPTGILPLPNISPSASLCIITEFHLPSKEDGALLETVPGGMKISQPCSLVNPPSLGLKAIYMFLYR